jgi:hypothetical protein
MCNKFLLLETIRYDIENMCVESLSEIRKLLNYRYSDDDIISIQKRLIKNVMKSSFLSLFAKNFSALNESDLIAIIFLNNIICLKLNADDTISQKLNQYMHSFNYLQSEFREETLENMIYCRKSPESIQNEENRNVFADKLIPKNNFSILSIADGIYNIHFGYGPDKFILISFVVQSEDKCIKYLDFLLVVVITSKATFKGRRVRKNVQLNICCLGKYLTCS